MDFNKININIIPGLLVVLDLNSHFLEANETALQWTGFKSRDQMIGSTYYDMPCKASEHHENFVSQDKLILNNNGYGKIIGLYCYNNDEWKVILAEKHPIKNENSETIALVSHITDLTHTKIIDVTKFVTLVTGSNQKSYSIQQTGFLVSEHPQNASLTVRQEECLFFLIRGKTYKEISGILNLSVRTIEQFIERLKDIFACDTKSELIEKAIANGYMGVIPRTLI